MDRYDHTKIEEKWQKYWESENLFQASDDSKKKKFYALIEFPYPSGSGLHIGHIRSNTAMDIIAHKRRAEGYNVLYPIGWDAFGLPTENYAIKTGIHPAIVTKQNTDIFRKQLKNLGFSFDWSREVDTSDPKYYKWTQWIFLQFLKKGLAYKKKMTINWCPKDLIGLANEEVIDGVCERCGTKVEKREKEQWMLAITKYADRLDKDLDETNFLEKIKIQQRNWIGKSEGAEIEFEIKGSPDKLKVFTTRPDTLYGVTYIVVAPDHAWVSKVISEKKASNISEVETYIKESKNKTEIERVAEDREKTGVELKGIKALNPATKEEIPVYVADYVLADYGTGAVMAVPAHDERDAIFAKKYGLPVKQVIEPCFVTDTGPDSIKENTPLVEREAILAIVKHWSEDKYMVLQWKKGVSWKTFITGGPEGSQTLEEGARTEVTEETGYKNLKLTKTMPTVHAAFFHTPKNVNRLAHLNIFCFQLENGEQNEISKEDQAQHDVLWLSPSEIEKELTIPSQIFIWKEFSKGTQVYIGDGFLSNSGKFNRKESAKIKQEITESVGGAWVTKFKLRDWIFSRQRYWGEPIPVVHCEKCGIVPLSEKDLPLELPNVKNYAPTETGESPLAAITDWVNTTCPTCKGPAKRETDTMPNWAGSSWYYLRYVDAHNADAFADDKKLKYWTPVDWYNGGMEHTTLHLLYSRFWHKFLFDLGLVPTKEPYQKRTSHGLILAEGGVKMSKSLGNVINPDDIVKIVGADALRTYQMFMGPFDQAIAWDQNGVVGTRRFIERVWKLKEKVGTPTAEEAQKVESLIHKTIKKVSDDIENMKFNTYISALMIAVNEMEKETAISQESYTTLLKLLSPCAPHVTEELWSLMNMKGSIHQAQWPVFDPAKVQETSLPIVVQVNGKLRAEFSVPAGTSDDEIKTLALARPEIGKWLGGKEPKKVIVVKGKLVNIVVENTQ